MRPADTTPEAWRVFLEVQRRMSPAEKVKRMFEMSRLIRSAAESGLRHAYPDAEDREIFLKVYGRTLPDDE